MKSPNRNTLTVIFIILVLMITFSSLGCLEDGEEERVVGIPEGEEPEGKDHGDYVLASVPVMNTYGEEKQIVLKFEIITEEEGHYSENKFVTLPKDSVEIYTQEVDIPEEEIPSIIDAEIVVSYDEIDLVEVDGQRSEDGALINAAIANTKFESERTRLEFEVTTDIDVYIEQKIVDVEESSLHTFSKEIDFSEDEELVDFDVQKI